jgi:hypothetical protein
MRLTIKIVLLALLAACSRQAEPPINQNDDHAAPAAEPVSGAPMIAGAAGMPTAGNGATSPPTRAMPRWPGDEWLIQSPEDQGMDSALPSARARTRSRAAAIRKRWSWFAAVSSSPSGTPAAAMLHLGRRAGR